MKLSFIIIALFVTVLTAVIIAVATPALSSLLLPPEPIIVKATSLSSSSIEDLEDVLSLHDNDNHCGISHSHSSHFMIQCSTEEETIRIKKLLLGANNNNSNKQKYQIISSPDEEVSPLLLSSTEEVDHRSAAGADAGAVSSLRRHQKNQNSLKKNIFISSSCYSLHFVVPTSSPIEVINKEKETIESAFWDFVNNHSSTSTSLDPSKSSLRWTNRENDNDIKASDQNNNRHHHQEFLSHFHGLDKKRSLVEALTLCLAIDNNKKDNNNNNNKQSSSITLEDLLTSIDNNIHHSSSSATTMKLFSFHHLPLHEFTNFYSRTIVSSNTVGLDLFAKLGVFGKDSVIGIADTGIDSDHCFFDDPNFHIPLPSNNNNNNQNQTLPDKKINFNLEYNINLGNRHRKFVRYQTVDDHLESKRDRMRGHGTHVAGTIAGNPFLTEEELLSSSSSTVHPNISRHHGLAPLAKLSFFDADNSGDRLVSMNPMTMIFEPAFAQDGALVHSNSWGTPATGPSSIIGANGGGFAADYSIQASQADAYVELHNEFLPVFAAGNDADKTCLADNEKRLHNVACDHWSVLSPSTAKNALSVGSGEAPLQSWVEADLGDYVVDLFDSSDNNNNAGQQKTHKASFNAVKAEFGMHHAKLAVASALRLAEPNTGCTKDGKGSLTNSNAFSGKVAVLYRGDCHFAIKAQEVQDAGAVMMLVINNAEGPAVRMGGDDEGAVPPEVRNKDLMKTTTATTLLAPSPPANPPSTSSSSTSSTNGITIPCVMISKSDGEKLMKLMTLYSSSSNSNNNNNILLTASLRETRTKNKMKNRHDLSGFSCRGPTRDLRYKPDIIAFGEYVHSAYSDQDLTTKNCDLWASMGTSMATPQVSAAAALVREFFIKVTSPTHLQFYSDTIKALLILFAEPLNGFLDRNMHGDVRSLQDSPTPNFEQGFGALRLHEMLEMIKVEGNNNNNSSDEASTSPLSFLGFTIREILHFTKEGEVKTFYFKRQKSDNVNGIIISDFKAVLTWIDPHAAPTSSSGHNSKLLIHDFDLIVDDLASGTRYIGNKYDANPPHIYDDRNNIEKVTIPHHYYNGNDDEKEEVTKKDSTSNTNEYYRVTVKCSKLTTKKGQRVVLVVNRREVDVEESTNQKNNNNIRGIIKTRFSCSSDLDCGGNKNVFGQQQSSNNHNHRCHLETGVCLCSNGLRGTYCQIPPSVFPNNPIPSQQEQDQQQLQRPYYELTNYIHPMQWQEFLIVPSRRRRRNLASNNNRKLSFTLRSMIQDGDPNLYLRVNDSAFDTAPTLLAALNKCDMCDDEGKREDIVVPRPQQALEDLVLNHHDAMFVTVGAGCCWQAKYRLGITSQNEKNNNNNNIDGKNSNGDDSSSTSGILIAPSYVSATKVTEEDKASGKVQHYYEINLEYKGEIAPSSIRFASPVQNDIKIPRKVEPFEFSCRSSQTTQSGADCTAKFHSNQIKEAICTNNNIIKNKKAEEPIIILEVEYYSESSIIVNANFVEGADKILDCNKLLFDPTFPHVNRTVVANNKKKDGDDEKTNTSSSPTTSAPAPTKQQPLKPKLPESERLLHLRNNQVASFISLPFATSSSVYCNLHDHYRHGSAISQHDSTMLPAQAILQPNPSCFYPPYINNNKDSNNNSTSSSTTTTTTTTTDAFLTSWLIVPRSISDFPIRIAIRFNVSLLQQRYGIESATNPHIDIAFKDATRGTMYSCQFADGWRGNSNNNNSINHNNNGDKIIKVQNKEEIVLCDLGGSRNLFIRSMTKLRLEIIDRYGAAHVPLQIKNAGLIVLPPPKVDGFSIVEEQEPDDGSSSKSSNNDNHNILDSDFLLPPHSSSSPMGKRHHPFVFNAVGSNLKPLTPDQIEQQMFVSSNYDDEDTLSRTMIIIKLAPQITFALQHAKTFLVAADSLLSSDSSSQHQIRSFASSSTSSLSSGFTECLDTVEVDNNNNSSSSSSSPNVISCHLPSPPSCGIPLTLQVNTARVLWGSSSNALLASSSSSSSNRLFFPALECPFMVTGIEEVGKSFLGVDISSSLSSSSQSQFSFDILGEFDTVKYLDIYVDEQSKSAKEDFSFLPHQNQSQQQQQQSSTVTIFKIPKCKIVSTSTKKARVTCALEKSSSPSPSQTSSATEAPKTSFSVLPFNFALTGIDRSTNKPFTRRIERLYESPYYSYYDQEEDRNNATSSSSSIVSSGGGDIFTVVIFFSSEELTKMNAEDDASAPSSIGSSSNHHHQIKLVDGGLGGSSSDDAEEDESNNFAPILKLRLESSSSFLQDLVAHYNKKTTHSDSEDIDNNNNNNNNVLYHHHQTTTTTSSRNTNNISKQYLLEVSLQSSSSSSTTSSSSRNCLVTYMSSSFIECEMPSVWAEDSAFAPLLLPPSSESGSSSLTISASLSLTERRIIVDTTEVTKTKTAVTTTRLFTFSPTFRMSSSTLATLLQSSFYLSSKKIEFNVRPTFPAALALHSRPFEVTSQLTSPLLSPVYLSEVYFVAIPSVSSSNSNNNNQQSKTSKRNYLIDDYCSHRRQHIISSDNDDDARTGDDNNDDQFILSSTSSPHFVANPLRFDHLYPCSSSSFFSRSRPFFVAACAKIPPASTSAVQLTLLRPPRFTDLHMTSLPLNFETQQQELMSDATTTTIMHQHQNEEGRRERMGFHAPHDIIKITPICSTILITKNNKRNNNSNTHSDHDEGSSASTTKKKNLMEEASSATIDLDRTKAIRLGVSANVAVHEDEAKEILRLLQEPSSSSLGNNHHHDLLMKHNLLFVSVSRFFFSSTPDCNHPIQGMSVSVDPSLTQVKVYDFFYAEEGDSDDLIISNSNDQQTPEKGSSAAGGKQQQEQQQQQTSVTFHFTAKYSLNAGLIASQEIFPHRVCHLCVKWNSSSADNNNNGQKNSNKRVSSASSSITKIATAKLGFCRGGGITDAERKEQQQQEGDNDDVNNNIPTSSLHCGMQSGRRNDDDTSDDDYCDTDDNVCLCSSQRRGAWCERECPASMKSGKLLSVCSSNGKCNADGRCECHRNYFGPACESTFMTNQEMIHFDQKSSAVFMIRSNPSSSSSINSDDNNNGNNAGFHLSLLNQNIISYDANLLQPSRQLVVTIAVVEKQEELSPQIEKKILHPSAVLFWYNQTTKFRKQKHQQQQLSSSYGPTSSSSSSSVLGVAFKDSSDGKKVKTKSPTYSTKRENGAVPFSSLSVFLSKSDLEQYYYHSSSSSSSSSYYSRSLKITVTTLTDYYDKDHRGCENGLCAVIAIAVGLGVGALGFAGAHIGLQMKNKEYKAHLEEQKAEDTTL